MNDTPREITDERYEHLQARILELEGQLQQARAELAIANQDLDDMAHFMAHDLRAPLRGVDGYSKALLEDYDACLDEVGKAYLHFICDTGHVTSILIDRLLLYMRAQRNSVTIQPVDLSVLAHEAAERLQAENPERQVNFLIQPGMQVQADAKLMKVLIDELINNAWKFTRLQPAARIVFCDQLANGQTVFVLQDNGAGYKMEYAQRLFQPFERLHATHEFEGTGLGLAICRRIVERHGGRIWAVAAPDQGASLSFTIPTTTSAL
jgi:light-regulated signal transduction histidine kinase (bacteriophytochrome)